MPSPAISRESPSFDVVVVGGGIAGLVAATRCAIAGLSVVALERLDEDRYVCNTRLTGGIFHLAHHGVDEPDETLLDAARTATGATADPDLLHVLVTDSRRVVRWLQSLGVRFIKNGPEQWQSRVLAPPTLPHVGRKWHGRSGDALLRTLESQLTAHGGQLLRGHRVTRLVMHGNAFAGVEGTRSDGSAFAVSGAHVVVADGGFQANMETLGRHICTVPARLVQRNAQSGIGDGLAMTGAIGASFTDLSKFYGHVLSRDALTNDLLWPYPWVDELARSSMVVGPDARRFLDEGWGGVDIANRLARLPDPASAVVVFDHAAWVGPGRNRILATNPHLLRAGGTVHMATALDALASMAGLPAAPLIDEVARYNKAILGGTPGLMSPRRSVHKFPALPVITPPFYAIPVAAGITYTMGGVRIDTDARVLDEGGHPIRGVYAAGSVTGGIEGGPHAGYIGGLCKAAVTGLRAAEHIAHTSRLAACA
jgi:fumarate reductase flavoprotein subunit